MMANIYNLKRSIFDTWRSLFSAIDFLDIQALTYIYLLHVSSPLQCVWLY